MHYDTGHELDHSKRKCKVEMSSRVLAWLSQGRRRLYIPIFSLDLCHVETLATLRSFWPCDQMLRHTLQRPVPPRASRALDCVQGYSIRHGGRRQLATFYPPTKEKLHKAALTEEGPANMPDTHSAGGKGITRSLSAITCAFTFIRDRTFNRAGCGGACLQFQHLPS